MKTVVIEVTQDDIEKGKPCSDCSCPIALAVLRQLPEVTAASAGPCGLYTWKGERFRAEPRIALPPAAHSFMYRFDDGEEPEPFSFEIEVNQ